MREDHRREDRKRQEKYTKLTRISLVNAPSVPRIVENLNRNLLESADALIATSPSIHHQIWISRTQRQKKLSRI